MFAGFGTFIDIGASCAFTGFIPLPVNVFIDATGVGVFSLENVWDSEDDALLFKPFTACMKASIPSSIGIVTEPILIAPVPTIPSLYGIRSPLRG